MSFSTGVFRCAAASFKSSTPRRGRGLPQLRTAAFDRGAADGRGLVDGHGGVAGLHVNLAEGHIEFFRHDLREGGQHAGAEIDLAREDGDVSVRRHCQPGIERGGLRSIGPKISRARRLVGFADCASARESGDRTS